MVILQIAAGLALGLVTWWLFKGWLNLWGDDNFYTAAAAWIGLCGLYAFIYDRRQARRHQSSGNPPEGH